MNWLCCVSPHSWVWSCLEAWAAYFTLRWPASSQWVPNNASSCFSSHVYRCNYVSLNISHLLSALRTFPSQQMKLGWKIWCWFQEFQFSCLFYSELVKFRSERHDIAHKNKTIDGSNAAINRGETRERKSWGQAVWVCIQVFVGSRIISMSLMGFLLQAKALYELLLRNFVEL